MIFESIIGIYEKISFLVYKTKIHMKLKSQNRTFWENLTLIKNFSKRFIKRKLQFCCQFFLPSRSSLFALVSAIHVDITYLFQHSVCQAKKVTMAQAQILESMIFLTYFAQEIKSCQNQYLCPQLFDSHSDQGY